MRQLVKPMPNESGSTKLETIVHLKIDRATGSRIVEFADPAFQEAAEHLSLVGLHKDDVEMSILPFVLGRCSKTLTQPCLQCKESGYVLVKAYRQAFAGD